MKTMTMLDFTTDEDHAQAQRICRAQGFGTSYAYTTSSDIPGLYCLPRHPGQAGKVVVKTAEFGFVIIETTEP